MDPTEGFPNTSAFDMAWKISVDEERLMVRCEISFLLEAATTETQYDTQLLNDILNRIVDRAQNLGKIKSRTAHEEFNSRALLGGAGIAHKLSKVDAALPPLQLVFKEVTKGVTSFISEPRAVAISLIEVFPPPPRLSHCQIQRFFNHCWE